MKDSPPAPVYLDYNATAPLLPAARERMLAALDRLPGNPSSPHRFGQAARDALESARAELAGLLRGTRREIVFNSGGTEGNNALLRWPAELPGPAHVIASRIEHPSVLRTCEWLAERGVAVDWLPVDGTGVVQVEAVQALLRPETVLVTLMAVNNETGVIQPVPELARRVRAAQAQSGGTAQPNGPVGPVLIHSDAVQAFGRMDVDAAAWGVDAITVAAHKLGGPKGVGAVLLRAGGRVPPLLLGGRQERERRAGTESVALVEGFLGAATWVAERRDELAARLGDLRDGLEHRLSDVPGFFVNGVDAARVPNTTNLGFEGVPARSLLVAADLAGVAISTGAACSSGAIEPSHVLQAMGLPPERLAASLRISLGWASTEADVERCAAVLRSEVARLRGSAAKAPLDGNRRAAS